MYVRLMFLDVQKVSSDAFTFRIVIEEKRWLPTDLLFFLFVKFFFATTVKHMARGERIKVGRIFTYIYFMQSFEIVS